MVNLQVYKQIFFSIFCNALKLKQLHSDCTLYRSLYTPTLYGVVIIDLNLQTDCT